MNNASPGLSIDCPNCHQPFSAIVESIIDGGRNPAAKARLLSRRLNIVQCPHCGTASQISVPLVYHDHEKELLAIYMPMEMNLPANVREKYIGEMTRTVMNSLPQEERKAYLFNPVNALTLDGLIKLVLEKEGITEEMIAAQQEKMKLVESFLSTDPDDLPGRVAEMDEQLDADFFELMTAAAEGAASTGGAEAAESILGTRDELLALSSYGQELLERAREQERVLRGVAERLQSMGPQLELEDFIGYLLEIGDSDAHLQALVSLVRPSLDYNFFMGLQQAANDHPDPKEAQLLEHIHERLVTYTGQFDAQQQAAVQQVAMVIQQLLQAPDLEEAVREVLPLIDDFFLNVLAANVQAAEKRKDLMGASRLRKLYEAIMEALQRGAPPEVQFINELLRQDDPLEARLMLTERAPEFGEPLVEYMNLLLQRMTTPETEHLADLLTELRDAAESILADGGVVR